MKLISPKGIEVEIQDFQETMFKAKGFTDKPKPKKKDERSKKTPK